MGYEKKDRKNGEQDVRLSTEKTARPTVAAMEALLQQPFPVLDHGFIRVVDYMGDDTSIVQAARVSYGRGTKKKSEDAALIRYLMRHNHSTPFEMCEIKLHVKLPIFVARQWIRHRTANVNEYSARYSILDREFYIPSEEQVRTQSKSNRQGRAELFSAQDATYVINLLRKDAETAFEHYHLLLKTENTDNEQAERDGSGLSRELARITLPLSTYTQWYWKVDLHNLFNFLRLRADSHAQYEIRVYAEAILNIVCQWVPIAHKAFLEYRMNGTYLSASALNVVRKMLDGQAITQPESGLSSGEWRELMDVLALQSKS
jgi:thymidylate synthase (FAD)